MAITLADLAHLTPAQRTVLSTYVALGNQLALANQPGSPEPVVLPAMTYRQARAVDTQCREMIDLIGKLQTAARHVMKVRKEAHVAQFETDNA